MSLSKLVDLSNPEKLFLDRYKRHYKLGQGGMGQVWKCRDTILDIDVAVKVLKEGYDTDKAKQRFQTEAKALAKLNHKNIVSILDFGEAKSGEIYMVMEHIDGVSLKQFIEDRGKLDTDVVLEIAIQILNGLEKAHKAGLVHRDIKPSNILIFENEQSKNNVKILDFGTAHLMTVDEQRQTPPGAVVGSPLYMSPESAKGAVLDPRADIYSFGCLLFECLTGEVPFRGESARQTLVMHIEDEPPVDKIEDEFFREIVAGCLKKNVEDRFESAESLMDKLINYRPELELEELIKEEPEPEVVVSRSGELRKLNWFLFGVLCFSVVFIIVMQKPVPVQKILSPEGHGMPTLEELTGGPERKGIYIEGKRYKAGHDVNDAYLKNFLKDHVDTGNWALSCTYITDDGVKLLDLNKLVTLDLTDTFITNKTLEYLKDAKKLEILELKNCSDITWKGLSYISDLPALNMVYLAGKNLNPKWSEALSKFKTLRILTYLGKITRADVRNFSKIKTLRNLRITPVDEEVLAEILKIKQLTFIHISRGRLSTRAVKLLSESNLNVMDLRDVTIDQADVNSFFVNRDRNASVVLPKKLYPSDEIKRLNKLSRKVIFANS